MIIVKTCIIWPSLAIIHDSLIPLPWYLVLPLRSPLLALSRRKCWSNGWPHGKSCFFIFCKWIDGYMYKHIHINIYIMYCILVAIPNTSNWLTLKTRKQLNVNDHRCCLLISERDDRSLIRSIQANIPHQKPYHAGFTWQPQPQTIPKFFHSRVAPNHL